MRSTIVAVLALVSSVGCGTSAAAPGDWEAEAQGAAHAFVLRADAGVREGPNDFELEVARLDGTELAGTAEVSAVVRMPAMIHDEDEAAVTRMEAKAFVLDDVIFPMPGTWELEVTIREGAAIDRVSFELDVP